MSILHDQYLPKLFKEYKRQTLKERFQPDLQPIKDLFTDMLKFQSRMDVLTKSNLKIKIPNGDILPPPFFNDDVFLSKNWVKYENEQGSKMKKIMQQLAA